MSIVATEQTPYAEGVLRRKQAVQSRDPFQGPIVLDAIAHVRNEVVLPRPGGWEKVVSELVFAPAQASRLAGLDRYSHVIVSFYMDMAADAPEKPNQIRLASGNTYGIFATRSQLRPNHLGVSVVPLLGAEGEVVRVRGLDAIDGTAVVDIKPYLPEYDAIPQATIPREG